MKTADEMFRELGYEKGDTCVLGHIRYEESECGSTITAMDETVEFSDVDGGYSFIVSKDEILACAQLIHEMEVNHD